MNIYSPQNQDITVNVYDINSKIIYSEQMNVNGELNKTFNLAGYSKGVYFLRIITNKDVYNEKLIIE